MGQSVEEEGRQGCRGRESIIMPCPNSLRCPSISGGQDIPGTKPTNQGTVETGDEPCVAKFFFLLAQDRQGRLGLKEKAGRSEKPCLLWLVRPFPAPAAGQ